MAGRACAAETFRQVDAAIEVDWVRADGDRLVAGDHLAVVAGPLRSVLTAERTALELPLPPLRRGHRHQPSGRRRGGGQPAHAGVGHPQDAPRAPGTGEGRRASWWRRQPSGIAVRHDPREGQPPGRAHDHRGGGVGAAELARPHRRGRMRQPRTGGRGGRSRRHHRHVRQHGARRWSRQRWRWSPAGRSSRCRAGSPSRPRPPTPPPAPTSSRPAPSPSPPPPSTSDSTAPTDAPPRCPGTLVSTFTAPQRGTHRHKHRGPSVA